MFTAIDCHNAIQRCIEKYVEPRGGSRAAGTSKMERFVIIVNGFILDVAAALDPPLEPLPWNLFAKIVKG